MHKRTLGNLFIRIALPLLVVLQVLGQGGLPVAVAATQPAREAAVDSALPAQEVAAAPQATAAEAPVSSLGASPTVTETMRHMTTNADREAAAARAAAARAAAGVSLQAVPQPPQGGAPDYFGQWPNWANSQFPERVNGQVVPGTGIRKFVDSLPLVGPGGANNLGQYLSVAVPDITTYPGSDYYEIGLVQYKEKMHSDLNPTTLRGYVQLETSANITTSRHITATYPDGSLIKDYHGNQVFLYDNPHYLGPVIVAQRNVPTRIKFTNFLPTGAGGNLFIPVDTTDMGAGMGPNGTDELYTQNRATLHLHGGLTPWISDGTPHQWTVPMSETTSYPEGVSVSYVPDMPQPDPGSLTFFYSNQQSARLMFYHDHAYGITRLNVYAGEAAGYLLTDDVEKQLVADGIIPGTLNVDEIPLVIQDKTFVPSRAQLDRQDPTWVSDPVTQTWGGSEMITTPYTITWGQQGDFWFPHVYMPNQDPEDMSGAAAMGRWDYGPWFFPPLTPQAGLIHGEVPNPYYGLDPVEPEYIPGIPNPSLVPEGFMDTPVINGTPYPYLTVEPKAYRFRILNAANDRFWNLQFYLAASSNTMWNADGTLHDPSAGEVPMVPAVPGVASACGPAWPTDGRAGGVPDPTKVGPAMVQIGTEGGFLPTPVQLLNTPVGYNYNRRDIVVLNVQDKTLFLGPAERADIIVDFSQYAGRTLILYNDGPAPVPAFDTRNDYYTGDPDQTSTGGAPSTLPGYGPNTRTLMQIRVSGTMAPLPPLPTIAGACSNAVYLPLVNGSGAGALAAASQAAALPAFNFAPLYAAFATSGTVPSVFAKDQDPIIVPADTYASAYGLSTLPPDPYVRIQDTSHQFQTITETVSGSRIFTSTTAMTMTLDMGPKAIQELFELDYGRMNATLGLEVPRTNFNNQTTIPLGYIEPMSEIITDSMVALGPALGDGTQIWKITHNGVDTHAIHFHLFNVQLINRVGWDGAVRPPDPNELGWKETVKMNPLEDAIVALRAVAPVLPWGVPTSSRSPDVTSPISATINTFDFNNGNPITVLNPVINFGWEYVWHCHLLGHEENDMMRPIRFDVATAAPAGTITLAAGATAGTVGLSWNDPTPATPTLQSYFTQGGYWGDPQNEIYFQVDRTGGAGPVSFRALANQTAYTDATVIPGTTYTYTVTAVDAAGSLASNAVSLTP